LGKLERETIGSWMNSWNNLRVTSSQHTNG
jgi:hypothetical protein